jgi:putative ubiquitin-RnfH superfamily antitoxin RatB of RatAB toxin-antitoxin module
MTEPERIGVETVLQVVPEGRQDAGQPLLRQRHRIAAGTTIRQLLHMTGQQALVERIAGARSGLAVFGKRAWLDDILLDGSRVEVIAPVEADAKAARVARAAADRNRRRSRISSVR